MRFNGVVGAVLAAGLAWAGEAQSVERRYELESEAELTADQWTFRTDSEANAGSYAFEAGEMRMQSLTFSEWALSPETTNDWFSESDDEVGWSIEARVRVVTADASCDGVRGPGIWIHDGTNLIKLFLAQGKAGLGYPEVHLVPLDTSDAFHVYRVQNLGRGHVQLLIDGELVVDIPKIAVGAGTEGLSFGDLGGCSGSETLWDYFAFDTSAPDLSPGDPDEDSVDSTVDNCPLIANVGQSDTDEDGAGDACDQCPADPLNDEDEDGLCADDDECPEDPKNDSNENGICDTQECAKAMGTCLPVCNCSGQGGFGGEGIDNWGGGGFGGSDPDDPVDPVGGAGHGGIPSSGGSAGSPTESDTQVTDPGPERESKGCACTLRPSKDGARAWWLLAATLALSTLRRRKHA